MIRKWATPRNDVELRFFMGLASYYRRFVDGFVTHAAVLASLLKKGIRYIWTEK
jgi:hypothetical protein